jgi:hypothetical protein
MVTFVKPFVLSVFVFASILLVSLVLMSAVASNWPEPKDFIGIVLNLLFVAAVLSVISVVICQQLARIPAAIMGLVIGLLVPVLIGWVAKELVVVMQDRWAWTRSTDPVSEWVGYLVLAPPGAIGGLVVGLLLAEKDFSPE